MRKYLKNNKRTKKYLEKLPKIYLVACWSCYGVLDFPFTKKYKITEYGAIPIVYNYYDANGTVDMYIRQQITQCTTGNIVMWTKNKALAIRVAEALNLYLKKDDKNER